MKNKLLNKLFLSEIAFKLNTNTSTLIGLIEFLERNKLISKRRSEIWLACEKNHITQNVYFIHRFSMNEYTRLKDFYFEYLNNRKEF